MAKKSCFLILLSLLIFYPVMTSVAGHEGGKQGKSQYSIVRSTVGLSGSSNTVTLNTGVYVLNQSYGQESVTGTFNKKGCYLLQGYQQTSDVDKIAIPENYLKAVVYPNPFDNTLTCSFDFIVTDKIHVEIYDLKGTIVIMQDFPATQNITLSLAELREGMYFMKVTISINKFFSPIIKQKQ